MKIVLCYLTFFFVFRRALGYLQNMNNGLSEMNEKELEKAILEELAMREEMDALETLKEISDRKN